MKWLPKLVITDIDGVWTDGGMFYDAKDQELKKFNTADSAGVSFLRLQGIPTAIITGENTDIVRRRAAKLKIDYVYCGIKNKVETADRICSQLALSFSDVAFVGDDLNDVPLLKKVGCSACPANAPSYIKKHASILLTKSGGEGAFREFAETLLSRAGQLERTIDLFIASLEKPE